MIIESGLCINLKIFLQWLTCVEEEDKLVGVSLHGPNGDFQGEDEETGEPTGKMINTILCEDVI